ncbi:hypothetical protein GJV85_12855 [Sulfurimonas aquatica]|uniref:Lipoprotein n=1 Tax=Sulfurimonas aquatica TaxID=2672570 RepID=A0A975B2G1_9BACT|nr:hypothetical protein [Sulfurimonas aquatica]QSZ42959.1 hypothetical protein GJV85_12855 [Sulfurimonas aquatica]
MIKKIVASSLVASALLFSGCGENNAEDRLSAQQALDKGDFSTTISNLESKSVKTTEDYMLLASAYMGKAGLSFTDTVALVSNANSTNDNKSFANYAKEIEKKKNPETLANLQKAISYYEAITGTSVTAAPAYKASANPSTTTGDRDLFLSLAYMTKATVVLSYLGDVQKLGDTTTDDPNILASACAISYVYSTSGLPTYCTRFSITDGGIDGDYRKISISDIASTAIYYRLKFADPAKKEMLLTDYKDSNTAPILIDGNVTTISKALVDTLNNSFDTLATIAPEDMKKDIEEFRKEIASDGNITAEAIANYLAGEIK